MVSKHTKFFILFSSSVMLVSLLVPFFIGVNLSTEFTGGSVVEFKLNTSKSFDAEYATEILSGGGIELISLNTNENVISLKSTGVTDTDRRYIYQQLEEIGEVEILQYISFGPSVSKEIANKAFIAMLVASLLILAFVSFAFRNASKPISSWKYGVVALIALTHDVVVPFGVFSVLGFLLGVELDVLFVMAILATLGYSINDTIVVFDRIRERLRINKEKNRKERFGEVVDFGIKSSIRRSIYTSLTTAIPLFLLIIFVPSLKWFALVLFIGVVAGTYSSLFFAPSILILWNLYYPEIVKTEAEKTEVEKAEERLKERLDVTH